MNQPAETDGFRESSDCYACVLSLIAGMRPHPGPLSKGRGGLERAMGEFHGKLIKFVPRCRKMNKKLLILIPVLLAAAGGYWWWSIHKASESRSELTSTAMWTSGRSTWPSSPASG
jgi:hypothetical protein